MKNVKIASDSSFINSGSKGKWFMRICIGLTTLLFLIILILAVNGGIKVENIGKEKTILKEYPLIENELMIEGRNKDISFATSEAVGGEITVKAAEISKNALFYTYTSKNGVAMQVIFVLAPNGEVRVGLNTSEDCKGEPDSYFIQGEGVFKCIHCGCVVANAEVGTGTNSAAPISIKFRENGDTVVIEEDDLLSFEDWFINWEGPLG